MQRRRKNLLWMLAVLASTALGLVLWPRERSEVVAPRTPYDSARAVAPAPLLLGAPRKQEDLPSSHEQPALPSSVPSETSYVIEGTVRDVSTEAGVPGVHLQAGWSAFGSPDPMPRNTVPADTDTSGRFRVQIEPKDRLPFGGFRVVTPRWQLIRWHVAGRPKEDQAIVTNRGAVNEVVIWVRSSFWLEGIVQDDKGVPQDGANIRYSFFVEASPTSVTLGSTTARTDAQGHFRVGPFAEDESAGVGDATKSSTEITISAVGFASQRLDARAVLSGLRSEVVIKLSKGYRLSGVVVDEKGAPLSNVPIAVQYGDASALRRATRTNGYGKWSLDCLTPGDATLEARAHFEQARAKQVLFIGIDDDNVRLVVHPIRLSRVPKTVTVLGMKLADVDDEIRAAYDLPPWIHVVILDPGADHGRLEIGRIEAGSGLWMVGTSTTMTAVTSIADVLERLTHAKAKVGGDENYIGYTAWNDLVDGGAGGHLNLSPEDMADIAAVYAKTRR